MQEENVVTEKPKTRASAWMRMPARVRLSLLVFLVCLTVYTLLLFLVPRYRGAPTTDGDEPHYLVITQSVLKDGDLFVGNNYRERQYLPYFENVIEMPHTTGGRGGRPVSTHPPFLSLFVLPGFYLFGHRGARLMMMIPSALAAMLTFSLLDRFVKRSLAAGATLFFFLTYPLLFYSRLIYPETIALFLLALGVWAAWRLKESGRPSFAATGGLSAGFLILFHPKFVALSAALLLAFIIVRGKDRRLLLWWLVPALSLVGVLLILTFLSYGPNLARGLTASGGSRLVGGYLGTNSFWGIPGMFLDRAWGLFIFAPLFMLFPHGLALQNNTLEWAEWWAFFPACLLGHVAVLGIFQSWNGGAAPVQRYLIPVAGLMVMSVGLFVERCRSRIARGAAVGLALLQIITTVWAFRFMVGTYGMAEMDNTFIAYFLGRENPVTRLLMNVFPLYHPAGAGAFWLTVLWIALFALTVWAARRYYMVHGGGKLSPVLDIGPFRPAGRGAVD